MTCDPQEANSVNLGGGLRGYGVSPCQHIVWAGCVANAAVRRLWGALGALCAGARSAGPCAKRERSELILRKGQVTNIGLVFALGMGIESPSTRTKKMGHNLGKRLRPPVRCYLSRRTPDARIITYFSCWRQFQPVCGACVA